VTKQIESLIPKNGKISTYRESHMFDREHDGGSEDELDGINIKVPNAAARVEHYKIPEPVSINEISQIGGSATHVP
jgi:hypothetical protein